MARFGSLLAATLAMSLTLGSSIGWADTPQPPAPNQTPLPATTSAPPPQTNQDRQPLPAPVYQNTPWKSKPVSEIASGACQILLPEEGFVPNQERGRPSVRRTRSCSCRRPRCRCPAGRGGRRSGRRRRWVGPPRAGARPAPGARPCGRRAPTPRVRWTGPANEFNKDRFSIIFIVIFYPFYLKFL